jgi:hypothetical protein
MRACDPDRLADDDLEDVETGPQRGEIRWGGARVISLADGDDDVGVLATTDRIRVWIKRAEPAFDHARVDQAPCEGLSVRGSPRRGESRG